jgi:hypothetical protein
MGCFLAVVTLRFLLCKAALQWVPPLPDFCKSVQQWRDYPAGREGKTPPIFVKRMRSSN